MDKRKYIIYVILPVTTTFKILHGNIFNEENYNAAATDINLIDGLSRIDVPLYDFLPDNYSADIAKQAKNRPKGVCTGMWNIKFLTILLLNLFYNPVFLLAAEQESSKSSTMLTIKGIFDAGGTIGYLIVLLSVLMFVLILQNLIVLRKSKLVPESLKQEAAELVSGGQFAKAQERSLAEPSLLSELVLAGLAEIDLSFHDVEKGMEEAAAEQSARLMRRLEYLNLIGTVAPMLGLLGTVWGMILTFEQFSSNSNPQIADLAPGISAALVTTLFGLIVAIPALSAYALFRNQVDALMAESAAAAEFIFASYRRHHKKKQATGSGQTTAQPVRKPIPPVAIEREKKE